MDTYRYFQNCAASIQDRGESPIEARRQALEQTKQELVTELDGKILPELRDLLQLLVDPEVMGLGKR